MDVSDLHIRQLSVNDLDQYNALLRYAFQVTEKTLLDVGWESDEIRQSKFPVLQRANVLGCFDEGQLVSQFAVYPLEMNIHDEIVKIGFITSVATYPEYSGLGLMGRLMKRQLTEMKEQGQPLALLYPYSIPLYRHRGWEIVADKMSYKFRVEQIAKCPEVPGYVRRVPEDSADLIGLHREFAGSTHGCLFRNHLAWEEYWRWDVDDMLVALYYSEADEPKGYMVYQIRDDVMYVKEMVYLDAEARKGLLKYIEAHGSMIDEVRGNNYTSTPIAFSLEDSDIQETIRPYIMGRIVDVEAFLARYRFDPDVSGTITFKVEDPLLEWNHRSFTVQVKESRGTVLEEEKGEVVRLSIGTLTTLLLGYIRVPELAKLERIQGSGEALKLLDSMIRAEKPYISDYI